MDLNTSVGELSGVGAAREKALNRLGIKNTEDLLYYFPRNYEDRTSFYSIMQAPLEETVCVRAMVAEAPHLARIRKGLDVVKTRAVDQSGSMALSFFNQPYVRKNLEPGQTYIFCGKIEQFGSLRQMTNPYFERENQTRFTGRIIPVYPLTRGIQNRFLAGLTETALTDCLEQVRETLPEGLRQEYALAALPFALSNIHFPDSFESLKLARDRLIFEELFYLSCALSMIGDHRRTGKGIPFTEGTVGEFSVLLPFHPTDAQTAAMKEISADLSAGHPMNRLLQGDVGSGKTAVAAFGAWLAWRNGYQCALMVPTEILAEQHFKTLSELLGPAGMRVELLTASTPAAKKREVHAGLAAGEIDLAVGTHALLSEGVDFARLGLVITDEQHRFGVAQRAALAEKADGDPHVLVMSATPIPRTLALMIYGDLDISVLDELPPGRRPVQTFLIHSDLRQRMYGFVRKQVQEGHQVYIVCPAVEEGEEAAAELKAVTTYAQELREKIFPDLRVRFVHGRMKAGEKQAVMEEFAQGEADVLVSTTVIEVGVDVPNASLMIVENAERFGLSQLHQLRGRVGRGDFQSYCVLVSDNSSEDTRRRLKVLTETNDGFQISEEDLKERGPGDFFGQRQHGLPPLRVASLAGDMRILSKAQQAAQDVLKQDPDLSRPENRPILEQIRKMFDDGLDLTGSRALFPEEAEQ